MGISHVWNVFEGSIKVLIRCLMGHETNFNIRNYGVNSGCRWQHQTYLLHVTLRKSPHASTVFRQHTSHILLERKYTLHLLYPVSVPPIPCNAK